MPWKKKNEVEGLEELQSQMAQKATEADLIIERQRINSFTTLAAGSTTGDAELIDTRIGADGVTYSNAGSAVRGQLSKLGNYLLQEIPMIVGQNIALGVGVGNVVNITPGTVTTYRYAILNCVEGDLFTINGAGGTNPRLWGFIDSNNILLSVADIGADVSNNLLLVAPKNASKLIINDAKSWRKSYFGYDLTKITRIERNKLNDLSVRVETVENTLTPQDVIDELELKLRNLELTINYHSYIVDASPKTTEVQKADQYNAWPFISEVQNKLVVVYSKSSGHEDNTSPNIYKKVSLDGGIGWSPEQLIINTVDVRDTVTGKGKDSNGNMLIWVRKGPPSNVSTHHLYRTNDGDTFTQISNPTFAVIPTHIGDIFTVPTVGLMAFYNSASTNSWGVIKSADNGVTWTQLSIQESLAKIDCPTEISGAYIGNGKIIAIGRKEHYIEGQPYVLFQIESPDYGVNWSKVNTNIGDISLSTPSLVYDSANDLLSLYYFERGAGKLRLRQVVATDIWGNPLSWSISKVIALGTTNAQDTGNVNTVAFDGKHFAVFYSGNSTNTAIYATIVSP
jgi:hypothetical protein